MLCRTLLLISLLFCHLAYGQSAQNQEEPEEARKNMIVEGLRITEDIQLPDDRHVSEALLKAVSGFLAAAEKNVENKWVLPVEAVETQILIDEVEGIQQREETEDEAFYKPYVTNIVPLHEDKYVVQIAYIGMDGDYARLRANFEIIAHKGPDGFLISSPLLINTLQWKTKKVQNHHFYYPFEIEQERVQAFVDRVIRYDEKLKNTEGQTEYYLVDEEMNPIRLVGVLYKSDYNSQDLEMACVSSDDNKEVWVQQESRIYNYNTHDLWHNRLRQVIPRKEVHRRVDCYIATLYGGIWELTWDELVPIIDEKYFISDEVDWLQQRRDMTHFVTEQKRKVYTDDFVGALLVKKIEEEKGFDALWDLLKTKRSKSDEEYFAALEKLTGITQQSYNREVTKLVQEEMDRYAKEH